jgi:hypothetical protein
MAKSRSAGIGFFERYLTIWVILLTCPPILVPDPELVEI